jgi:beta-glucosidase
LPKHFVRAWRGEGGWDYNSVEISDHTLREVYLPAFCAALDEGAVKIKGSFNALNGVQATANPFALTEILGRKWEFPGQAVTGFGAMRE